MQTLASIGSDSRLLIVLEDLHWADRETLSAVEYLVDNVADAHVGVLLTTRPDAPVSAVVDQLSRRGAVVAHDLARLDDIDGEQLVRTYVGDTRNRPR